jgi:hypothetical protein
VPVWFEGRRRFDHPRARSAYHQVEPRVAHDRRSPIRRAGSSASTADLIEEPNVGGRWVAIGERLAVRYRGEAGRVYLQATLNQPRWLFYIRPQRLITWNGAGWHEKYAR